MRFEKAPDAAHVAVPEIELSGLDVTRQLLPSTPTGAVCGLGPVLFLDGREISTKVTGTMADITNGSPLDVVASAAPAVHASTDPSVHEHLGSLHELGFLGTATTTTSQVFQVVREP